MMTTANFEPIPLILNCHLGDHAALVSAAAAAGLSVDAFCKLAIHVAALRLIY